MKWEKFHTLVDDTVAQLKKADGDQEVIEAAIKRYIDQGINYVHSPFILWDYFAISSPAIPERAGYCGFECEQMVAIFDRLTKARFGG